MSQASISPAPSPEHENLHLLPGLGVLHSEKGIGFRVWAPNAERVSLIGTFNQWNESASPMTKEDGGTWYAWSDRASIGDEYKYRIFHQGNHFDRIDPRARQVTNSVGSGVIHSPAFDWGDDQRQMPSWNEAVIYEMHIGTFNRQDENHVGTFEQVRKRFGYLKKLGVNVLQIMPIAEFAGDLSWGYNPAHVFAIESAYGGPGEFKRFVRDAHTHGFAVVVDVVYNHFGPSDLDLWQFDGWQENDKGGIYFYNDHRSSTPWGDTRPDYGRGEVRSFIRDNAVMWLEEYHVDGLRFDMTLYIRSINGDPCSEIPEGWGLTQWVNREVRNVYSNALTIAEDLQNNDYLTKSESEGGAGFGTQWDAGFVHPVREVLTAVNDCDRDMNKVLSALLHWYNGDAFQRVVYTESHDEVANGKARVPSEVDSGDPDSRFAQKRSALGAALVLTAPGIPMLFQGQEFLEQGWFQDSEELDWERKKEFTGIVRLHSDLIGLRRNRSGKTAGLIGQGIQVHHVNHVDKVIAYLRFTADASDGSAVLVVANFSDKTFHDYQVGVPTQGNWHLRFNSDASVYSEDFRSEETQQMQDSVSSPCDGQSFLLKLTIGPYAAQIYSLDRDLA